MVPSIVQTLRSRLTLRRLLPHAVFLALAYGVTGSRDIVLALVIALTLVEVIDVLHETPAIDDRWVQVGIGAFVSAGSLL